MAKKEALQIPEETLKALGIDLDYLKEKEPKTIEALEGGKRTPLLYVDGIFGDQKRRTAARIHLYENKEGKIEAYLHTVQPKVSLKPLEAKGFEPTNKEAAMLIDGNTLPYTVELKLGEKDVDCVVGVDPETREVRYIPKTAIHISETILGVDLSKKDRDIIRQGGKVHVEGFTPKEEGEKFNAVVSFSFSKNNGEGGIVIQTPTPKLLQLARLSAELSEGKGEKKDEDIKKEQKEEKKEDLNKSQKENKNKEKKKGGRNR